MFKIVILSFLLLFFLSGNESLNISSIKNFIFNEYKQELIKIYNINLFIRNNLDMESIHILSLNMSSKRNDNGYVKMKYSINNSILQENIKYTIEAKVIVYRTKESIKSNSNIDLESLKEDIVDINAIHNISNIANLDDILNSSSKSYMSANSIIYKNKLSKRILVFKNDIVVMVFRNGGIIVTSTGNALSNGGLNDYIKVQNIESKKIIQAKIVGEKRVLVE